MRFFVGILFLLMLTGAPAAAQSLWERLVLPGDLTEPHAKLQNDCSNCHVDFAKGAQTPLCLDCHKETRADIDARTGFHGRSREAQAFECNHCHTDHEGRDFEIVIIDQDTFDHTQTDFALVGAHGGAPCGDCHEEGKPFREAPSACFECHREDDRHDGNLGKDCQNCHKSTAWAEVTAFDHSKTEFPLTNAHEKVGCAACHAGEIYEDLPTTCIGCHRIQDIHDNRFGPKCEECHSNTKWTEIKFDHDKNTDFTLTGAHRDAVCNDCHANNIHDNSMKGACQECHGTDDPHLGALGPRCDSCHTTSGWIVDVRFDHDLTTFPLIGQHGVVPCEACHRDQRYRMEQTGCAACHAAEDVHKGRLGERCATCHNPNGWALWLFDHDRQTRFALTGAHGKVKCETCHSQPAATGQSLPLSCIGCHGGDDVHRGRFGRNCSACHSTATWKGARLK